VAAAAEQLFGGLAAACWILNVILMYFSHQNFEITATEF